MQYQHVEQGALSETIASAVCYWGEGALSETIARAVCYWGEDSNILIYVYDRQLSVLISLLTDVMP